MDPTALAAARSSGRPRVQGRQRQTGAGFARGPFDRGPDRRRSRRGKYDRRLGRRGPFTHVAAAFVIEGPEVDATTAIHLLSKPVRCMDLSFSEWDRAIANGTLRSRVEASGQGPGQAFWWWWGRPFLRVKQPQSGCEPRRPRPRSRCSREAVGSRWMRYPLAVPRREGSRWSSTRDDGACTSSFNWLTSDARPRVRP
jgi:hypothetical protein